MSLAAVHLDPIASIAAACAIGIWVIWYWRRLARADVPTSRRHLRRVSLAIMMLSLPVFVLALSFLDPAVHKRPYTFAWSFALLLVMLIIITAILDAMNSLRVLQQQRREALHETAAGLARDVRARRKAGAIAEPWRGNGHAHNAQNHEGQA